MIWFSPGFQVVGYLALIADDEVPGLAESFNQAQRIGFGDFTAEVPNQEADESILSPWARGGGFAKVIQHPGFPFAQAVRRGFGLRLGLRFAGNGGRGRSRDVGVANKWEGLETSVTIGGDVPAPKVCYERIITSVSGDDVKVAGGIGCHGAADVVGEGEIEGVPASGSEAHQLHRDSVLEKLFDQGSIEFCLPRPYQQRETDRVAPDDREVNLMDILEINKHMVHRRRKMSGGMHKSLQDISTTTLP